MLKLNKVINQTFFLFHHHQQKNRKHVYNLFSRIVFLLDKKNKN